ncbi:hypothetical protein Clacol_005283 [Clathrus columnatus]|uniref:Cytochrome P450 n=1 Tax=Clathrus columnatus TaxID=1419009 RepID=A0AAV5ABT7_9AGAM|nr:hypothetical protein Clacol_005283 [Clathrus columnatus]
MSSSTIAYTGLAGVALYFVFSWWKTRIPRGLKRPPGPPGHLLIGNLLDLPRSKEWLTFDRWANEYGGDLFYLSLPGASILFVNSYELAKELFDKRGSIYSDRYQSTVLNEFLRLDRTVILQQYGEKWRRDRTYFHRYFGQGAVGDYHEVQIRVLLKRLYQSPEDYRTHLRCILGASVLEVTYGIEAISEEDPLLILSETTTQRITEAGIPGTYLVDIFPILKYIPSWFPGAKFSRELNQVGKQVTEMLNKPVEIAKASLKNGDARSSVVSALIENFENDLHRPSDYEDIIKQVTGVAYLTAIDTEKTADFWKTNGLLLHFVYTMLLHPEVQKRAQEELDEVVGSGALPSFEDFGSLKYTRAVFQELLRWNAVTPSGVPHILKVDDVVNGSLLRSKSVYGPDADKFNPKRFLNEGTPSPDFAFGYGRRECPGRYFAENGVFIAMINILHIFNILPFEGENGPQLPPENHFESGLVLILLFKTLIVADAFVHRLEIDTEKDLGTILHLKGFGCLPVHSLLRMEEC